MMISNTDVILGLHKNLFSVTLSLQKGFQFTLEGKALILKKIRLKFGLMRKWQT